VNIYIDGVNTDNKGAELMLYAVLQELEKQHPDASIFLPRFGIPEGVSYFKTSMNCKQRRIPAAARLFKKMKGDALLRRFFHIPYSYTTDKHPLKGLDLLIDAGGFQFADQHYRTDIMIKIWNNYYQTIKKQGTKIFFLPQAFGPFETENGRKQARLLEYADCVFAREETSYNHLVNAGVNKEKILVFPDFTALVDGVFPLKFEHLKNGIAVMPNLRMIDKNIISRDGYIETLIKIINICRTAKKTVFFLNNEAQGDYRLCEDTNEKLDEKIPIVRNLTALEIKGLLSQCYFVFSSRFHGIASALSAGVPCIATGWSHKYNLLFKDYDMEECTFDPGDNLFFGKLGQLLNPDYNSEIRNKLINITKAIKDKNREMWRQVWMRYNQ